MNLENVNIRVKKYPKGYVVEIQKEKRFLLFFTKKYWIHIISVSGIRDKPWYYKSKETAINEAVRYFERDLYFNS